MRKKKGFSAFPLFTRDRNTARPTISENLTALGSLHVDEAPAVSKPVAGGEETPMGTRKRQVLHLTHGTSQRQRTRLSARPCVSQAPEDSEHDARPGLAVERSLSRGAGWAHEHRFVSAGLAPWDELRLQVLQKEHVKRRGCRAAF